MILEWKTVTNRVAKHRTHERLPQTCNNACDISRDDDKESETDYEETNNEIELHSIHVLVSTKGR